MQNRVHLILNSLKVERWIFILIEILKKSNVVTIEIREAERMKFNFCRLVLKLLFKFEQITSPSLRTNIFDVVTLDSSLISKQICDLRFLKINLTNENINESVNIFISDSQFSKQIIDRICFSKNGSPFVIQTVLNGKNILKTYRTSNSNWFITNRRRNIIASLIDTLFYTIENNGECHNVFSHNVIKVNVLSYLINYPLLLFKTKLLSKFDSKFWHIGLKKGNLDLDIFKMPKNEFWADPFILEHDKKLSIFFERMPSGSSKGLISHFDLEKGAKSFENVIEEKCHLSFPSTYYKDGTYYLIPESKEDGNINLYKSVKYPTIWEKFKVLIPEIQAVDSVIVFYDNMFWLFCTVKTTNLSNSGDVLKLFYAKDFFGPWVPHKQNPIKMDNSSSRGAGHIFQRDGFLFRPVQNCSFEYGGSIKIMKIINLSTEIYEEIEFKEFLPKHFHNNAIALHTINYYQDYTIVDLVINKKYANKD